MPIYEYRCLNCQKRFSLLIRGFSSLPSPHCPSCGSERANRLISRFSVVRSEESQLEALADPSQLGDLDENDPRSVARWARKMSKQVGEDLGPEFDEMVGRLEAGEDPESVERAMGLAEPDLGSPEDL
jgi:putative FmdB family regulatory protein